MSLLKIIDKIKEKGRNPLYSDGMIFIDNRYGEIAQFYRGLKRCTKEFWSKVIKYKNRLDPKKPFSD